MNYNIGKQEIYYCFEKLRVLNPYNFFFVAEMYTYSSLTYHIDVLNIVSIG